ncbi:LOW QUALITY PROTEIN: Helitron helicase, partial [Phytophthora megakarya]
MRCDTSESAYVAMLGSFHMRPTEVIVVMDHVPLARCPPVMLRCRYSNPRFKQLIRAYNNISAFTSMGSSRFRPLKSTKYNTK